MKVIKRDGTRVPFDKSKIVTAINKALEEVDGKIKEISTSTSIASDIYESFIYGKRDMGVEEIQDMVELKLMQSERPDVAKAYILYRDKRTKERERKDRIIKTVIERNSASNIKNSNANVDEKSFSGREKEAASDIQKIIALDYTLSPEIGAAHKNMLLYQHDLEKTNLGVHNCFGRETKFITIDGVKSFEDFEDGDIVIVRDAYGNWKKAIVKNYGPQDLYLLTFKNGRCHQRTIRATANHRWILHDGSITENLKVGDRLLKAPQVYEEFNPDKYSTEELMMWCKGFGLGDGTVEYNQSKITGEYYKSNRTRIRLCGEKDNKWLPIFEKAGCRISNQTLENGDKIVTVPYYHKEIPEFKNIKEVLLFFNGLYAADGTQTSKSSAGKKMYNLQSSKLEIIDFIYKYADAIGMYISAERDLTGQVTNYGTRPYTITFSFKPDFSFSYKLIDKKIDSYEDVWCLEVEDTHSFLLANGIPTGNCLNLDFEELFSKEFVCRNGGVRSPQSIATAMSLVAVAFQCQSQTQFG